MYGATSGQAASCAVGREMALILGITKKIASYERGGEDG
jgi:hypothetical protein